MPTVAGMLLGQPKLTDSGLEDRAIQPPTEALPAPQLFEKHLLLILFGLSDALPQQSPCQALDSRR